MKIRTINSLKIYLETRLKELRQERDVAVKENNINKMHRLATGISELQRIEGRMVLKRGGKKKVNS